MKNKADYPKAGLFRRLAALIYDGLVIIAIEMMAAGVVIAVLEALVAAGAMEYAPYIDASDLLSRHPVASSLFTLYLVALWVGFFVYFWTRAGQTVGMRAWKLRVQNSNGNAVTLTQALIRVATSAFGLANLSVPFDPEKRGFHDMWAKTEVIVLKEPK
ncbi:RDD family protein [Vibrio sp. JC009]|uniref:RDD family protein n=1 Tax=Vibrio sp. JC009 TaxID=2912314 RepID=UPI0023AE9D4E|nr:RDD family protein [Vibrio sp. JC009]WED22179.1 RDD family protein [Vibrio sp. JC009]